MRRAMLSCAVVAAIMIGAAAPAYAQELDKDITKLNNDITKLIDALNKLKNVEGETSKLIANLQAEIARIKCDTVECKLKLLRDFKQAIGEVVTSDKLTLEQLKDPVLALLPELSKLGAKHHSKDTAIAIADAVTPALDSAKPQQPDFVDTPGFEKAITTLQKWQSPTKAATNRATELLALLNSPADKPKNKDAALKAELDELVTAIHQFEERKGPHLNIVQAWFGDFYFIRKAEKHLLRIEPDAKIGHRVCDATAEVRENCQGKPSCPFKNPEDATKLEISGARLCGYHPAPHAARIITGVVVEYECLTLTQAEWDDLLVTPRAKRSETERVALRAGSTTTIRCITEFKSVAKSEAKSEDNAKAKAKSKDEASSKAK